jgi:ADP-ribose pyrophosphatase YjhB (NUDIX family)
LDRFCVHAANSTREGCYWELPGGRVDIGESASTTVVREVHEGVHISVTAVAGAYSDPAHVLAYSHEDKTYQQFVVCFHAFSPAHDARPDHDETATAAWFPPDEAVRLPMHPAMRQRLTDALDEPERTYFD